MLHAPLSNAPPTPTPPVVPSAGGRPPASMDHLHVQDRVRLREACLDLPQGAEGVVIGFYRTDEPAVAVKFGLGVRKVAIDRLEPVGEDE